MKKRILAIVACSTVLAVSQARASTFNYDVNFGLVTGNITTNCNSCNLDSSNIVSWSLSASSVSITSSDPLHSIFGNLNDMVASSTGISFNFSDVTALANFNFQGNGGVIGFNDLVYESNFHSNSTGAYYVCLNVDGTNCTRTAESGNLELATIATTPLPAALPLFATGLGALGLFGWRRKRKAAALAAA